MSSPLTDGLATVLLDELDDLFGGVDVRAAFAVQSSADVVDNDPRALAGQHERLFASDTSPCAGDHRHFAVEQSHRHASLCQCSAACDAADPFVLGMRARRQEPEGPRAAHAVWPIGAASGAKPGQRLGDNQRNQRGGLSPGAGTPEACRRG